MQTSVELHRDGHVATIRLVPAGKLATLSRAVARDIDAAVAEIEDDPAVRCAVIAGTGRSFVIGADLTEMTALGREGNLAYNQLLIDLNRRVEALPFPTVASLNGHAFGGGLELALACSIRVASRDAQVGFPEAKVGILPGSGGAVRLPRLVGHGAALRIMLTGRNIEAAEAFRIGLVEELADAAEAGERADAMAQEIAANAPLATRAIVAAVRDRAGEPVDTAVQGVHEALGSLLDTTDASEGMEAFLARRPPTFTAA